ncbi:hypothetical protein GCM10012282_67920 [Streptomyces lacrimifluminis]|uniref:Uncharacterized protein n=1 Tax=Streptomyces lacrimifluminis TaxID=1500077 RepID=A0A917P4I6_9ACTN|nr:hypothetical protein GCM10012282_67920 [Streptomyces lacrimifluminis]
MRTSRTSTVAATASKAAARTATTRMTVVVESIAPPLFRVCLCSEPFYPSASPSRRLHTATSTRLAHGTFETVRGGDGTDLIQLRRIPAGCTGRQSTREEHE